MPLARNDDALEVGEAGLVAARRRTKLSAQSWSNSNVVAGLVDDLRRMGDVPDLALDVVVAAVDALAEAVVEAAEVPAALAVHPAEVLERVGALRALGVGQPERAAAHPRRPPS